MGLIIWTLTYIGEGILYVTSYQYSDIYEPYRVLLIMDCVGFSANLFNFAIMAYVIYSTSRVLPEAHKKRINSILIQQQSY